MKPNPTYSYFNILMALVLLLASVSSQADSTANEEEALSLEQMVTSTEGGAVTASPEIESYPVGTEVTLTATPNPGYEFAGWLAEKTAIQAVALYDNIDNPSDYNVHPIDESASSRGQDIRLAQQFLMGGHSVLSQVTVSLRRHGTVRGSVAFELWSDNGSDEPGEKIDDLGVIPDVSTIFRPTRGWPANKNDYELYTFGTDVAGLEPEGKYWVVSNFQGITSTLAEGNTIPWAISWSDEGSDGAAIALGWNPTSSGWVEFSGVFPGLSPIWHFQMQVLTLPEAKTETETVTLEENTITFPVENGLKLTATFAEAAPASALTLAMTEDGAVNNISPDMENYPVGTEITATAQREEGFEFVKWTYGNEEFTTNPATIVTKEGATLTPIFAKQQAEPISIDIAPAMAISWDSQSGKIYEIQSSTDLEN